MKKNLLVSFLAGVVFMQGAVSFAEKAVTRIMPPDGEGSYGETDKLSVNKISKLPVPNSREDYAFIQSIGNETCVVLGLFKGNDRRIIMITDSNNDGKADGVATYYADTRRTVVSKTPAKDYSEDQLKKMKQDIINGVQGEVFPNPEGSAYLKKVINGKPGSYKRARFKNGYKIFVDDPDILDLHRVIFYYSNNTRSGGAADLAFEVVYNQVGPQMVSPVIKFSVYCKDSTDPVVQETVKELLDYTSGAVKSGK
jgi:hypothetical protein